jgi:hypothetical protein
MSRKKRFFLYFVCGLTLLLAAGLWWLDSAGKQAVADAQARCRAAGLPMTIDEIRPPSVPDADNAALVIAKIKPVVNALPDIGGIYIWEWLADFKDAHAVAYKLDPVATQELAGALDSQPERDLLALIHEAASKQGYDDRLAYEFGPDLKIENIGPLLRSVKLLRWQARLAASRGQAAEASGDVWAMTTFAEFLANEPFMISQMARSSVWSMALEELEQLAATGSLPQSWNQKISARLSGLNFNAGLARAVDGERLVEFEGLFQQIRREGRIEDFDVLDGFTSTWRGQLRLLSYRIPGVIWLDYAYSIDGMRERRDIVVSNLQNFTAWEKKLKRLTVPIDQRISTVLLDTIDDVARNMWKSQAKVISGHVGLALERFRSAKGEYPATLTELVPEFLPEVPVDVFSGKPLIYRTEPGGAVVYSVGPNMKDDGGFENIDSNKDDQGWFAGAAALRKFAPLHKPASP